MDTLISTISTVTHRNKLYIFLDRFMQNIYDLHLDVKSMIQESLPHKAAFSLIEFLGNDLESRNTEGILEKCRQLEHIMDNIEVMELTVALSLSDTFILDIQKKVFEITKKHILITFKIDPEIIGGAKVESNGTISDYTVTRYFEYRYE